MAWRRAILKRDRSCKDCGTPLLDRHGEPLPTAHADHVVPVRDGGQWTMSNGAGRCDRCHGRATVFHDGGFGNARRPKNE